MIAILTNSEDATADFFEAFLAERETRWIRLDTDRLQDVPVRIDPGDSARQTFSIAGQEISLGDIGAVLLRRPRTPRVADTIAPNVRGWVASELRSLWGGLLAQVPRSRWVNHPSAIAEAGYKPEQLVRAPRHGLAVPPTLITNDPNAAHEFWMRNDRQVIAKPIGHGEVYSGDETAGSVVYTSRVQKCSKTADFDDVRNCPTLFQREIEKRMDVRVTVVGGSVVAVALHSQDHDVSRVDCRRENMVGMRYQLWRLPKDVELALLSLVRSYDLLFAAIDMVCDVDGRYWFLEVNPSGQWAWLDQLANADIAPHLLDCLETVGE